MSLFCLSVCPPVYPSVRPFIHLSLNDCGELVELVAFSECVMLANDDIGDIRVAANRELFTEQWLLPGCGEVFEDSKKNSTKNSKRKFATTASH